MISRTDLRLLHRILLQNHRQSTMYPPLKEAQILKLVCYLVGEFPCLPVVVTLNTAVVVILLIRSL